MPCVFSNYHEDRELAKIQQRTAKVEVQTTTTFLPFLLVKAIVQNFLLQSVVINSCIVIDTKLSSITLEFPLSELHDSVCSIQGLF